jgi:nitrogenase molybdenum-iron protein alpha/beta subunit
MDAARYFGTFRACFGIKDAIIINHVPVGCNWGAMLFATRSNQPDIRNVCSVMHEGDSFWRRKCLKRGFDKCQQAL